MKIAIIISVIVVVAIIGFLIYRKYTNKQNITSLSPIINQVQPNLNTQSRKCETGYNTSSGFVGGFFYTDNKGPCTP